MQVDVREAEKHLSRLVDRAAAGEQVVITRAGKPVARLVPVAEPKERREPGVWQGRVRIAPDFDELPPELRSVFGG
jgi:prevent-host-death family protein